MVLSNKSGPGWKGVALYDSHTDTPVRMAQVDGVIRVPVSNPAVSDQLRDFVPTGTTPVHCFGRQVITSAKTNVDIWGGPTDTQPEPDTSGYALFVKSDDAQDDTDVGAGVPGTGAHTVHIHYMDTAYAEQTVSASLNGTTEVDTGVTDCIFVTEHHVTGFGAGGGIVATGNIDCLAGSGGAVVSRVQAAGNQSMSTMCVVPAGKKMELRGWHAYGTAATTKLASIRPRASMHDGVSNPGVYHFLGDGEFKDFSSPWLSMSDTLPEKVAMKMSGWTTGAITIGGGYFGWFEDV